jgi:hypothetical protein
MLNTSLWHQELLRAASAEDLLSTVQDYLVLWRPDELAQLPVRCDPASFLEACDVSEYATALLAHEGEGRRSPVREALTAFFAIAARRAAELATGRTAPTMEVREAAAA